MHKHCFGLLGVVREAHGGRGRTNDTPGTIVGPQAGRVHKSKGAVCDREPAPRERIVHSLRERRYLTILNHNVSKALCIPSRDLAYSGSQVQWNPPLSGVTRILLLPLALCRGSVGWTWQKLVCEGAHGRQLRSSTKTCTKTSRVWETIEKDRMALQPVLGEPSEATGQTTRC